MVSELYGRLPLHSACGQALGSCHPPWALMRWYFSLETVAKLLPQSLHFLLAGAAALAVASWQVSSDISRSMG